MGPPHIRQSFRRFMECSLSGEGVGPFCWLCRDSTAQPRPPGSPPVHSGGWQARIHGGPPPAVRELVTPSRENGDEFLRSVVGLGAPGIVTGPELSVRPSFRMRQRVLANLPWDSALADFIRLVSCAYSVSLVTDYGVLLELEELLRPFGARPHCGKLFTRSSYDWESLYPRFPRFPVTGVLPRSGWEVPQWPAGQHPWRRDGCSVKLTRTLAWKAALCRKRGVVPSCGTGRAPSLARLRTRCPHTKALRR